MGLSHQDWVTVTWATSVPLVVMFALLAMFLCYRMTRNSDQTVDNFITARHSVGLVRIAWSFYAGALGSWVITGPASYASYAGLLGLSFYAFASGFPVIIIAFFGKLVQDKVPSASSAADYVNWRFGPLAQLYVVLLILFNMSMALLSEYTTMSSLFRDFVGTKDYPIILTISLVTLLYTVYGGLFISIITDQFQGAASVVFAVVIAIYVGINFDAPLPTPLNKYLKGTTEYGYSSILTMPLSLMSATVFSEAMWQRCWASSSPRVLYTGSIIAAFSIIIAVFGFGFLGFLAVWGGLTNENTNPNLYVFQVFKNTVGDGTARLHNWAGLVTILAACTMSQAAVDSLQNGIMGTVSSYLLKNQPLFMTRFFVAVLNIPLIIVGLKRYNILKLFLVSNMLCTTSALPVALGLVESLHQIYTGDMMVYSCIFSILATSSYGIHEMWDSNDVSGSIQRGFKMTWYDNAYDWHYFAAAIISSITGLVLCIVLGLPFTLLGWRGISPTRWFEAVQRKVVGIWHQPRKEGDESMKSVDQPEHAAAKGYPVQGAYTTAYADPKNPRDVRFA